MYLSRSPSLSRMENREDIKKMLNCSYNSEIDYVAEIIESLHCNDCNDLLLYGYF